MICCGYNNIEKIDIIDNYLAKSNVKKIYVFSPEKFQTSYPNIDAEYITYKNIIEYEYFYRLLQEIDQHSLLIIDECMRTQNRNDLTYNCLRHYINQAGNIIIFQYIPIISDIDDFMILFDFDTKSQWKRNKFDLKLIKESECEFNVKRLDIKFNTIAIPASKNMQVQYQKQKIKFIDNIGLKDPDTIPRNLYLIPGKEKTKHIKADKMYIGRNNRFKLPNLISYRNIIESKNYTIFEFPHNFIDFTDFLFKSLQLNFDILSTNIKVDQWYVNRYSNWLNNLNDVYTKIQ